MTANIQTPNPFSQLSMQNQELAQELAKLTLLTNEAEDIPVPTKSGKGVSRSGKGGNETSFKTGNGSPVTVKTLFQGMAKVFNEATPQGRFNFLKQLGVPLEEINKSLGHPEDSTKELEAPDVGSYFAAIALAMNASNKGNNASIMASLQQIAQQQGQLNTVSASLVSESQTAQNSLAQAQKLSEGHSFWESIADVFTNWKALVVMIAVSLVIAAVPMAVGALSSALAPLAEIAGEATEAAETAEVAANVIKETATAADGAAEAAVDGATNQVTLAERALAVAQKAKTACQDFVKISDTSSADASLKIAQRASEMLQKAASESSEADYPALNEQGVVDLEESATGQTATDAEAANVAKVEKNWWDLIGKAKEWRQELQMARVLGGNTWKAAFQAAAIKTGVTTFAGGMALIALIDSQSSSPASTLIPAELSVVSTQTQVLTNQAQIINMNISTAQTQENNYNTRNQADAQMVQQILAMMSQVFNVKLN
jgi:hypothetical protein